VYLLAMFKVIAEKYEVDKRNILQSASRAEVIGRVIN
jgi:hypothetical protein